MKQSEETLKRISDRAYYLSLERQQRGEEPDPDRDWHQAVGEYLEAEESGKKPVKKKTVAKKATKKAAAKKVVSELSAVNGIGPKYQAVLQEGGVKTLKKLGSMSQASFDKKFPDLAARCAKNEWISKAKKLAS